MNPTMLLHPAMAGFLTVSPATGDPVLIIAAVAGVSVAALIVLSVLSKRGKGGRRR